jgi:plastocyanin domain-containing protein
MIMLINIVGLALLAGVVLWFWLWPQHAVAVGGDHSIDIEVANGVYTPDVITVKSGEPVTLRFHRRDASPCSEHVIFHGLDIDETLPAGGEKVIRITPSKPGTIRFTCQMQMYQGELRVEANSSS